MGKVPFFSRPERVVLPLALTALGLVAISAYRSWQGFERANREALFSREVLDRSARLLDAVLNAETGQRGYLLTGRSEYLAPFTRGEQEAPIELKGLERLGGLRADLRTPLQLLAPLVAAKLAELQQTIDLRKREGPAAALLLVQSDRGRQTMDAIRTLCSGIMSNEYARWEDESKRRQDEGRWSLLVTFVGTTSLFALLALALVMIHRSTEQREQLISKLHERGELLQTTLASIGDGVIVTDAKGDVTFLNGVAELLTGWPLKDAIGTPLEAVFRIIHEETRQPVESPAVKVLREGVVVGLANHTALLRRDGKEFPIADSGAPIRANDGTILGVVLVFRDVSDARNAERERRLMEERLQQTAKLESLGVLAGGVAHDFNNLLVGILGNASLAREALPPDSEVNPMLNQVVAAAERAAELTRQMLAYAGKGRFFIERFRLGDLVRTTLPLIQASIPRAVRLEVETREESLVEADATQLQQIVMNLVINAGEACGDRGGAVTIATCDENVTVNELRTAYGAPEIAPGQYVVLEVRDTGAGMDEQTLRKIFDPFFTTKFTGRGLGLAAVLGIVRGHRGALQVTSRPGEGSTFRVLLPVAGVGKPSTILVVESESGVRRMAQLALERSGYTVVGAESHREAAEQLRAHADQIAAVVLDLGTDGTSSTLSELRQIRAGLPVVITSGLSEAEVRRGLDGHRIDRFLRKPYTAGRLWEEVKAITGAS